MKILGIDPSTRTGVAIVGSGKSVLFASELEMKKQVGFERISGLVAGVMALHEEYKPDLVVIEDMFVGHASSAVTIIQIGTLLRYFLWQEGIPFLEVSNSTLKKFVAGKGGAKKEEMMMYVLKNWSYTSKTNNIADAVSLGMFGLCCVSSEFSLASRSLCRPALDAATAEVAERITTLKGK